MDFDSIGFFLPVFFTSNFFVELLGRIPPLGVVYDY